MWVYLIAFPIFKSNMQFSSTVHALSELVTSTEIRMSYTIFYLIHRWLVQVLSEWIGNT